MLRCPPFISSHPCLLPLPPSPPPPPLCTFILFSGPSQIDQIFALLGPRAVYFLECVFSSGRFCAVAQQRRLRLASVWLSSWGPSLGRAPGLSVSLQKKERLAAIPSHGRTGSRAPHTLQPFTPQSTHRIEYGLFGGRWQCQEC